MARLALGVVVGLVVGMVVGTAIVVSHAQDETPQAVVDAAQASGVDPVALAGAVNTMQDAGVDVSPREYLYAVGELERPYVPPPYRAAPAPSVGSAPFGLTGYLATVAWCESRFNPNAVGKAGEIGLFQLASFGLLPMFYDMARTLGYVPNPRNGWSQAAFARWAFAHGYAGKWTCA